MIKMKLKGSYTALITPFDDNYEIDEAGYRENIDFQIENGIHGLLPVGTTGESATMSHAEHKKVVDIAVDQVNGKVPVLAGAGSNNTTESLDLCKHAQNTGADAVLIVCPYYNKPTQEGLYQHYKTLADSIDIPLVIYNVPSRTGKNIEAETTLRLAEIDNIIGIKEASGDINQCMKIIKNAPSDFSVMSGNDDITMPLMAIGGKGVVSVVSNMIPDKVSSMCNAMLEDDIKKGREIFTEIYDFCKDMFIETNPIPIKTAMNMIGRPAGKLRLPLVEPLAQNKEKIKAALKDIGLM